MSAHLRECSRITGKLNESGFENSSSTFNGSRKGTGVRYLAGKRTPNSENPAKNSTCVTRHARHAVQFISFVGAANSPSDNSIRSHGISDPSQFHPNMSRNSPPTKPIQPDVNA